MVLASMKSIHRAMRLGKNASGQALVEYSLLLAFIAALIISVAVYVGGAEGVIQDIGTALEEAIE